MARVVVRDRFTGKRYEIEVYPENTAEDVINTLVDSGIIQSSPGQGWEWRLVDSRGFQLPSNTRVIDWLSRTGEQTELMLTAHWTGGA
ncbi:MAG: hypothetical protein QXH32_05610 [Candidatus Caldarchaeum sp.]